MDMMDFKNSMKRRAIRFNVGGFRPSGHTLASHFGKVTQCKAGEAWPFHNEKPMLELCQLNLTELPFKPQGIEDLGFLTVFISS